jgi:hypothetical protein
VPVVGDGAAMKLIPASRALATIRVEVASSVGPPNIMVPRQIGEIFRPLRPRLRYCIGWSFECGRHCEEQSDEAIQPCLPLVDCFAEPVIGRAFARPVGSQ